MTAIAVVLISFATPAAAQEIGGFAAEVGLTALADGGELGISLGGSYGINETISASGAFSYFFCGDVRGVSRTCYGFDVNGRYMLTDMFYAVAGLNWAKVAFDTAGLGSGSGSDFGLNVGAGANLGPFFGEARFALGGWDDLVPVFGFRFPVGGN
jgi:hypothetical protein